MLSEGFSSLKHLCSRSEAVDLEADFKPNLLNSAVYLISLSQQVSTFAVNFQGRPFREGITENPTLYYGLLCVDLVTPAGSTLLTKLCTQSGRGSRRQWSYQLCPRD